jgi:hypothetical protein
MTTTISADELDELFEQYEQYLAEKEAENERFIMMIDRMSDREIRVEMCRLELRRLGVGDEFMG